MARRFALRDKVSHPGQCKSYREMLERLVSWKVDLADYVKAGAPQPPDEDLRHALMKMLPWSMSSEMRGKAWAQTSAEDLEEWVRVQDEFEEDYCKAKSVHLAKMGTSAASSQEEPADDDAEYPDDDGEDDVAELPAEVLAMMTPQQVNAFYEARGKQALQRQTGRRTTNGGPRKPSGQRPGDPRTGQRTQQTSEQSPQEVL